MPTSSPGVEVLRLIAEVLDEPHARRAGLLAARCPDPAARAAAERLLAECERAEAGAMLSMNAVDLAAPMLAEAAAADAEADAAVRDALADRYPLLRLLGQGGQGSVFLARDLRHGRDVALKVVRLRSLPTREDSARAARFRQEVQLLAHLSHPHIVPLFDSGVAAGRPWYVAPFVEGESLRDRLVRRGSLPVPEAVGVMRDIASALAHAHRRGVVHRDIKPANLLCTPEGDVLVTDFGVAATIAALGAGEEAGLVVGTAAYMAPEQAEADAHVDERADLYALGAVAHELLTGAPPLLVPEAGGPPRAWPAHVPTGLARVLDRLLAGDPDARPRDADEVLRALDDIDLRSSWTREAPVAGTEPPGVAGDTAEGGAAAIVSYRKGRFLLDARQRDAMLRALAYFESAVALEPGFAAAHGSIGETWVLLGAFGHHPQADAFARGREAAARAISLGGPGAGAGHAALAHVALFEWRWRDAADAFDRLVAMDPRNTTGRMYQAAYLHSVGRPAEALATLDLVRAVDPLHPTAVLSGRVLVDTGRAGEALPALEELVSLDPRRDLAHQLLAHAHLHLGNAAEAVASMERAAALSGRRDQAQLAYIHAATGDHAMARRILAELPGTPAMDPLGFHVAMAHAGLGDVESAFAWLERAYATRGSFMNLLAVATGFESLRADARLRDILRRMGLLDALPPSWGDASVGAPNR